MNTAEIALRAKLDTLECHFTWRIDCPRSTLLSLRDHLEDIGTDEGYRWLGHIYNLWAYIYYTLGSNDAALRYLSRAGEAFRQINNTVSEEGPWLLVNYGNQAWLNYHLNQQAASRDYLKRVDALLRDYPSPYQEELHPEVYVEKGWTLMKFEQGRRFKAIEYFQKAIRMEPDRTEWQTSHVLAIHTVYERCSKKQESEILEKLRIAKEHDPENTYLASVYLLRLAKSQKVNEEEARALAKKVLRNPASSYGGLRPLLRLYRMCLTHDEAIDLANEALERHPNERFLKRMLAISYKWKVISGEDSLRRQSMIDKAISLFEEVISLYPESSIEFKLDLTKMSVQSTSQSRELAEHLYEQLLKTELDSFEMQMVYNNYAQYLFYEISDYSGSIDFHMKAAEVLNQNRHGKSSVNILKRIVEKGRDQRCVEIQDFLGRISGQQ